MEVHGPQNAGGVTNGPINTDFGKFTRDFVAPVEPNECSVAKPQPSRRQRGHRCPRQAWCDCGGHKGGRCSCSANIRRRHFHTNPMEADRDSRPHLACYTALSDFHRRVMTSAHKNSPHARRSRRSRKGRLYVNCIQQWTTQPRHARSDPTGT